MADNCLHLVCKFIDEWHEITGDKTLRSIKQLWAFLELNKEKGITTGEVVLRINSSQPAMYNTIKHFEELGLGKKQQDPFNGKSYIFIPSKKGKELLAILEE